jgi:acetyl-CoA C-acetyltransferase
MATGLDPRLPVLVGTGQLSQRTTDPTEAHEPAEMMVQALRAAEAASEGHGVLADADAVFTVHQLSGRYANVGRLVADRVGASPRRVVESVMGGNLAGSMVNAAARAIQAGDADVVLVAGAEAWRTRSRARARGVELGWTVQGDDIGPAEAYGDAAPLTSPLEEARGVVMPVHVYPLFEVALRAELGLSVATHRRRLGRLWSAFSEVAAENPHAWVREALSPEEISEASPDNRMVSSPYTKRLCSNNAVDQGAALVLTSVAAAEAHGVPRDNWVFLHSGADAVDHWHVSSRADLRSSPAIRLAGRDAFALAGIEAEDLAHVDLYSCFPVAVQIAARELGLVPRHADEGRGPIDGAGWGGIGAEVALTVTGGMSFAGGPWNDYPTHGLATMWDVLRRDPGATGLCTANGGYVTEHAMVVLSSDPPTFGSYRHSEPQAEVDALPACAVDDEHVGPVTVESGTVVHDREGPVRALVAARTPVGARTWCATTDVAAMEAFETVELVGRAAHREADGTLHLDAG